MRGLRQQASAPPRTEFLLKLILRRAKNRHTAKKITRSYKDDASKQYIAYVCRIADPDIGDGTIEKAMKDRIKRRG